MRFCEPFYGAKSQIFSCVVQSVVIEVADAQMLRGSHQVMMHLYRSSVLPANGVERVARSLGEPTVLDKTRVVLCVNDSELTPCKRDQTLSACPARDAVYSVFDPPAKAYDIR